MKINDLYIHRRSDDSARAAGAYQSACGRLGRGAASGIHINSAFRLVGFPPGANEAKLDLERRSIRVLYFAARFPRPSRTPFAFLAIGREIPSLIGAVAPSGPVLAKAMAKCVDIEREGPVVELGPGTGPVTEALLARVPRERLILVEYRREVLRSPDPALSGREGSARRRLQSEEDARRASVRTDRGDRLEPAAPGAPGRRPRPCWRRPSS